MSDLVGNCEDRFSCDEFQTILLMRKLNIMSKQFMPMIYELQNQPAHWCVVSCNYIPEILGLYFSSEAD